MKIAQRTDFTCYHDQKKEMVIVSDNEKLYCG